MRLNLSIYYCEIEELDFFENVVDTITGTIWSFLVYIIAEGIMVAAMAAIQPALAILVTASFAIGTILDLVASLRRMEAARILKTFLLALIQVVFTLYLISLLGT